MQPQLSIVIPVLGFEPGLESVLQQLKKIKEKEVIIVLTPKENSNKTREIAQKYKCKLVTENRKGYGQAYITGFKAARGKIIATLDADGSYPTHLLPKYHDILLNKNLDFLTMNRLANLEENSMLFSHLIGNHIITVLANFLFQTKIKDSQSGMWLFRREILPLLKLKEKGMSLSTEIKLKAFTSRIAAKEIDSTYTNRLGKATINFKDAFKIIKFLFRTRLNKNL